MTYTDEETVRAEYEFLRNEEVQTDKSGATLLLKERAYSIVSVYKNGVLLTEGSGNDYTFQAPRKITLSSVAVTADFFELLYNTNLSSGQMANLLIKADNIINSKVVRRYGSSVPFTSTPVLIREISTMLVGAYAMRSMLFKNHAVKSDALKLADSLIKEAGKMLGEIDKGTLELIEEEGDGSMDMSVGRGGEKLFSDLREVEEVDYYEYFYAETKADTGETGPTEP